MNFNRRAGRLIRRTRRAILPELWAKFAVKFPAKPTNARGFTTVLTLPEITVKRCGLSARKKFLRPIAVENFDTLRELIRMPTIGYIHIRLGRDKNAQIFDDDRFQFSRDENGKLNGIRVTRGTKFKAGDAIGTLNPFNHVHLIAGKSGAEMNALDALKFPGIEDKIAPKIESLELFDENRREIETEKSNSRINLSGKTRIVVQAFDQMNGGASYRKLGVYRIGYQILNADESPFNEIIWTINFDRMPDENAVKFVYAEGSQSGYKPQTVFRYIASNVVNGDVFREDFFDANQFKFRQLHFARFRR